MLLPLVSVTLFLLSFPLAQYDVSFWPLSFFCLAPLFAYLERTESPWKLFCAGCIWGSLMSLGLAYWLFYAMVWQYGTPVTAALIFMIIGLMLPHGAVYGLFALVYAMLKKDGPLFRLLAVPSIWVVAEYSREAIPLLVPWGFLGYALQPWNLMVQMADITGLYGLSFLLVMVNSCILLVWRRIDPGRLRSARTPAAIAGEIVPALAANRVPLAVVAALLIAAASYGAARRHLIRSDAAASLSLGRGMPVSIAQGNFTQKERWNDAGFFERLNVSIGLSERCLPRREEGAGPVRRSLIVWPETILNSQGQITGGLFKFLRSRIGPDATLIVGGVRKGPAGRGVYNTAYIVSGGESESVRYYDKNILLPYAETAPFGSFLGDFYTAPAAFLQGDTPPAARTDAGTAGLSICFEAVYPGHIARSVRDGARFLVNISNDGWFGRTSEPVLHLRQSSLRAVENRRYLVRAANNGFSAIISPDGSIKRTGLFATECLSGEILPLSNRTIYSIAGDWIVYAAALILIISFAAILFRKSEP